MRGQWTARRGALLNDATVIVSAAAELRRGLGSRRILFEIGNAEFQLIEQRAPFEDRPNCSCRSLSIA